MQPRTWRAIVSPRELQRTHGHSPPVLLRTHGSQPWGSRNVWEFRRGRWRHQSGYQHDHKRRPRDYGSLHAGDRIPRRRPGMYLTETGSNVGNVNGNIDTAPPPPTVGCPTEGTAATFAIATQAATDALAAYNNLTPASRPGGSDPGAGQLGALVLPPGIYKSASGSFLLTGSDLTLDGQGNANAIWVFQMASSLTVGSPGAPAASFSSTAPRPRMSFGR